MRALILILLAACTTPQIDLTRLTVDELRRQQQIADDEAARKRQQEEQQQAEQKRLEQEKLLQQQQQEQQARQAEQAKQEQLAKADPAATSKQLYTEAGVEFDLGHFSAALEKYESAYRLRPVTPALFNIGQCYRRLNRLTEAANTFRTFIAKSPESPSVEKARVLLADVEEQINTSKK